MQGYVDRSELKQLLLSKGETMAEKEVDSLLELAEADIRGRIKYLGEKINFLSKIIMIFKFLIFGPCFLGIK